MVQSKVDLKHNNRNVGLMKGITYNCHGQGVVIPMAEDATNIFYLY